MSSSSFSCLLPQSPTHFERPPDLSQGKLQHQAAPNPKAMDDVCQLCKALDITRTCYEDFGNKLHVGPPISVFVGYPCPLAKLICSALDEYCGPKWAESAVAESRSSTKAPLLLFKNGPGAYSRVLGSADGNQQKMLRLSSRIILLIDSRPPWAEPVTYGNEKLPLGSLDSEESPFTIGELELLPDPSEQAQLAMPHPRRPIGPLFDCGLARQWLEACKGHSPPRSGVGAEAGAGVGPKRHQHKQLFSGDGLRLIDVVQGCLANVTESSGYVALSYVWGKAAHDSLRADRSNLAAISLPGALHEGFDGKRISRTVADAMRFVRELGYRYLWVDALCILQDSIEEKRRLIHGMGHIYENAICTIVEAAGADADAGLHGIRPRVSLPYEKVSHVAGQGSSCAMAMARPSLADALRKSHWHSRGWTYQEICLSPRSFCFTPNEVFFSCEHCHRREGYALESTTLDMQDFRHSGPSWLSSYFLSPRDPKTTSHYRGLPFSALRLDFETYRIVVREYTSRQLTFSSDIINAFEGIFNRFADAEPSGATTTSPASVRAYQAIPPRLFPMALLWYPPDGTTRRLVQQDNTTGCADETLQLQFSSWSWASWDGPVDFDVLGDSKSGGYSMMLPRGLRAPTEGRDIGSLILQPPKFPYTPSTPRQSEPRQSESAARHKSHLQLKRSRREKALSWLFQAERFGVNTSPSPIHKKSASLVPEIRLQKSPDPFDPRVSKHHGTVSGPDDWYRLNASTSAWAVQLFVERDRVWSKSPSSFAFSIGKTTDPAEPMRPAIREVRHGVIAFWAVMVQTKITLHSRWEGTRLCDMDIEGLDDGFTFRPDDCEGLPAVDSFIATLVRSYAVYGIGVQRRADGTFRRVGIGAATAIGHSTSRKDVWGIREVQLS